MPREVVEQDEAALGSAGRAWAALALVVLACVLPLVPVLVASGLANGLIGPPVAGAAAGLAAVFGGGKLAAVAWGLVGRWEGTTSEL